MTFDVAATRHGWEGEILEYARRMILRIDDIPKLAQFRDDFFFPAKNDELDVATAFHAPQEAVPGIQLGVPQLRIGVEANLQCDRHRGEDTLANECACPLE